MKALSVKQPWAQLIVGGHKTIETRTWGTSYRGDFLLCSSLKPDHNAAEYTGCLYNGNFGRLIEEPEDVGGWCDAGCTACFRSLARGQALAVVRLVGCRPMTEADEAAACCNTYDGAFAWVLDNVRPLQRFPVKGRLGIWAYQGDCEQTCREWWTCTDHRKRSIWGCPLWFPADSLFLTQNQAKGGSPLG